VLEPLDAIDLIKGRKDDEKEDFEKFKGNWS